MRVAHFKYFHKTLCIAKMFLNYFTTFTRSAQRYSICCNCMFRLSLTFKHQPRYESIGNVENNSSEKRLWRKSVTHRFWKNPTTF